MVGPFAAEPLDAEPSAEGVVIASRYELISQIGVGGMGIVWRARDRRLARAVAVKVLSKTSVGSDVARTRLIREARAAAALEHEGIIRVYDVGETDDGGAFLVMELIRGRSLRWVLEKGSMKPGTRAAVIVQAARALQFAHDAGIVHRDVKPDNIMIRDDGRVTVVDFGVAKPISTDIVAMAGSVAGTPPGATLTGPGQLVGTPAYLAPEQARGLDVSAATDQFALAVTAFEAFTGKRPWTGVCFSEVIASLLRDAPEPISSAAPVPLALDEVFGRALAKEPEDRYVDIGAFADALEDAAAALEVDEPVSAKSSARDRRATPVSLRERAPSTERVPERSATAPITASETITSTKFSSVDAASAIAESAAPARQRARHILAAALGAAIVAGGAWSLGRTAQPVGATAPAEATQSSAQPQLTTSTPATEAPTTPVTATTMSATSPTAEVSANSSASSTSEPTSTPRPAAAKPRPAHSVPPSPSMSAAPLASTAPATATSSTSDVKPASKQAGRRVRTEL